MFTPFADEFLAQTYPKTIHSLFDMTDPSNPTHSLSQSDSAPSAPFPATNSPPISPLPPPPTALLLARLASLADDTRLRLLRLLERHELGVADLCDVLQLPQSTVSRHLKVLADLEWLKSRRQGTAHLYRMIPAELDAPAQNLWHLTRSQSDHWPTSLQDAQRLDSLWKQRLSPSQAFFASAAAQWSKLRRELYGERFALQAMLSLIDSRLTVADLACGSGQITLLLAPHVQAVLAVDNSSEMLLSAKETLKDYSNVKLHQGDLESLPLPESCADAAILSLALTYLPDPGPALAEAARILKPGGKLLVIDLQSHERDDFRRQLGQIHLGFSRQQLADYAEPQGLKLTSMTPLSSEPGVKGPALFCASLKKNP